MDFLPSGRLMSSELSDSHDLSLVQADQACPFSDIPSLLMKDLLLMNFCTIR
jgi:hypothetical protein